MSEKPKRALNPWQKSFMLGVSSLALMAVFALRLVRTIDGPVMPSGLEILDLMFSDLALGVGISLVSLAIIGATERRALAVAILQGFHLFWLTIEGGAFNFFMTTRSPLDWQLVWFAFEQFDQIVSMVRASTSPGLALLTLLMLLLVSVLPWFFHHRADPQPEGTRPPSSKALGLAGVIAIALAWTPPLVFEDSMVRRNATLTVIATGVEELWRDADEDRSSGAASLEQATIKPREGAPARDVIIIVLESTRASATTIHNPELATTPVMAEWAKGAMVFENAFTLVPHTSKALVTTLCGTEPMLDISIAGAAPGGISRRCLARLLDSQGYHTAFFQPAFAYFEHRYALVNNMGYEHFVSKEDLDHEAFASPNYLGVEDLAMLPPSEAWLSKIPKDERVFMTYLTLMSHHDYKVPEGWDKSWGGDKELDAYHSAVHYLDKVVEEVFAMLERQGRRDDALILIVGDHGEAFGEHGRYLHDDALYQEGIHIPLALSGPGLSPRRAPWPVSQLDILPTLVHHAGFAFTSGSYPGQRLDIAPKEDETRRIFSFCWYQNRCGAVIDWPYKYIDNFGISPPEYYDLSKDPLEKHNIHDQHEDAAREKRDALMEWVREVRSR